jgi:hypothetical protein
MDTTTPETKFPADVRVARTLRVGGAAHVVGDFTVDGSYPTASESRVEVTGSSTHTTATTSYLGISAAGNITLTLGELGTDFTSDLKFVIKDESGGANPATAIKTIAAGGSDTIDGRASIALTSAYEAVTLFGVASDGTWFIH